MLCKIKESLKTMSRGKNLTFVLLVKKNKKSQSFYRNKNLRPTQHYLEPNTILSQYHKRLFGVRELPTISYG